MYSLYCAKQAFYYLCIQSLFHSIRGAHIDENYNIINLRKGHFLLQILASLLQDLSIKTKFEFFRGENFKKIDFHMQLAIDF